MIVALLLALIVAGDQPPTPAGNDAAPSKREAFVTVKMEVNEAGAVDKCEIAQTDAPAKLAAGICPIFVSKAKFKPQLDAAGKPQRASYTKTVKFVIED